MLKSDWKKLPKARKQAIEEGQTSYFTGKVCPQGHVAPRITSNGTCAICARNWTLKGWNKRNPKAYLLVQARKRAKERNLDFDLTTDDFIIPSHCPFLNVPLKAGSRAHQNNSPSLHRLDNSKGYTKDNVAVVSYKANRIINNASFEEFQTIYENWKYLQS